MLRQAVVRPLLRTRCLSKRTFSLAAVRMGEGDTGAPKAGGVKAE
jgi:ATPase inhibitor, mitochondrial